MDQMKIGKEMIDFNKATFNNYFAVLGLFHDQAEKAVKTMVAQFPAFPEDAQKNMDYWMNACKQALDNSKNITDKSFQKMEEYFAGDKKK